MCTQVAEYHLKTVNLELKCTQTMNVFFPQFTDKRQFHRPYGPFRFVTKLNDIFSTKGIVCSRVFDRQFRIQSKKNNNGKALIGKTDFLCNANDQASKS